MLTFGLEFHDMGHRPTTKKELIVCIFSFALFNLEQEAHKN